MQPLSKHKYLTEDEFKRLLQYTRSRRHQNAVRDYAIMLLGGLCGLRSAEVIALRLGDIHTGVKPPYITVTSVKKRTRQRIDMPIQNRVVIALREWMRRRNFTYPWERIFQLTTRQLRRIFKRCAAAAGLSPKLSFHSLRHFRGLQVFEASKDIQLTKDALRHSSIVNTQVYVHTVDMGKLATIDIDEEEPEGGEDLEVGGHL